MLQEATTPLTREEQLELENANLKTALAQQQLQMLTQMRNVVLGNIGRAHGLKEGSFEIDAAAGVIRKVPAAAPGPEAEAEAD